MNRFPRKRAGDSLSARDYNVLAAELDRLSKAQFPGSARANWNDPAGPTVVVSGGGQGIEAVLVKAPVGGIPARNGGTGADGTASCTLYTHDGTKNTLSSKTETVHNWVTAVVGAGSKDVLCVRTQLGFLLAINEVCG
jgi:hypothetical protein